MEEKEVRVHNHFPQYSGRNLPRARGLRRNMTNAERRLWSKLRRNQLGMKFRRQVPFSEYILDFFCAKAMLCVEVDGSQHFTTTGSQADTARNEILESYGVEVIRFSNIEVLQNTDAVAQAIYDKVVKKTGSETPPVILSFDFAQDEALRGEDVMALAR